MAKKTVTKTANFEREYVIPLREKSRNVPRYRKTEKAVKTVKEFIAKHMKVTDRDVKKVRLDSYLNELLWIRGIKKHTPKVKVKAVKEGDIVRVYAVDLPDRIKFKKERTEKADKAAKAVVEKKKTEKVPEEKPKTEEEIKAEEEKKEEEKEKKSAVVEAGKEMEKAAAKRMKHQVGGKIKEPKHPHRMSLQK